ncbi:MAG TPA: CAP domain-containing protein [Syntrophorhabdaceae bacterium]|jgi:hypothetical protein
MVAMKTVITRSLALLVATLLASAALWSCAGPVMRSAAPADNGLPLNEGARSVTLSDMERDVVRQINDLRANPKKRAAGLKGGEETEEAALFLNKITPLPPLKVSRGLCLAARELLIDHGPRGLTGHKGSDGSTSFVRMNKYGQWDGKAGENLYYGYGDAHRLMQAALTEGGSQGWEQRNNLVSPNFNVIGIACGPHHVYRTMCVIDFAESYLEMP